MPSSPVPILMYHKVAPVDRRSTVPGHYVPPGLFARQMGLMRALGFRSVPLPTLFDAPLPKRPFAITFDDGYQNFLTNALPALRRNAFTATVFLVANQLGGVNAWDIAVGDVELPLLTVAEIAEARAHGTDFGSHSLDHTNLARADEPEAWRQIAESRTELEAALGYPVETFCYPYGAKTPEVQRMVARAGYRIACSTEKGANRPETDRTALRRINVRSDTILPVFALKLLKALRHAD